MVSRASATIKMARPLESLFVSCVLYVIFLLISVAHVTSNGNGHIPCSPRDFGHGSVVCVCNATYCDTVEPDSKVQGGYAQYTSTKSGLRLSRTEHTFSKTVNATGAVFTLDYSQKYQKIIGFGGAFTDAAGINIKSLSSSAADNLLRSYFSPQGIRYSVGRVPMASCDFSTRVYSYDDSPGDFQLTNFSLAPEDLQVKIPYIKRAQALSDGQLKLFASPWGPPYWLKSNQNMSGQGTLLGQPGDRHYKTWAQYFVKFLKSYGAHNVTFWGLTAENEPSVCFLPGYTFQCLGFTPALQRDFIALDLGPALEEAGYGDVRLMILDDQRLLLPLWADIVLADPRVAKYVSGIAIHWYLDQWMPPDALTETHKAFPEYFMLGTEACEGATESGTKRGVILGSWDRLETYAADIIQDLTHWVSGWTDWNLALNMEGGPNWVSNFVDSPVIVNAAHDEFYKQPMYYAMGHFSYFLPPDSVRVGLALKGTTSLEAVAFLTPSDVTVVIALNRGDSAQPLHIEDPQLGVINTIAPPHSLLTFTWSSR